jgi:hypothetical protein
MTTTMSNAIPVGSKDVASKMAEIASSPPKPPVSKWANRYRGVCILQVQQTAKYQLQHRLQ